MVENSENLNFNDLGGESSVIDTNLPRIPLASILRGAMITTRAKAWGLLRTAAVAADKERFQQ
jgi:hypothetical protein